MDGDDDALFMSACPGPVRLLKDLARLLWMYVTFFGFLTGGGLVSADDTHTHRLQVGLSVYPTRGLPNFFKRVPRSDLENKVCSPKS